MSARVTEETLLKGLRNERRVLQALTRRWSPAWLRGVRPANDVADSLGVDLWVDLDSGTMPLQIKSSRTGARKHRAKGYETPVLVVRPKHTERDLVRLVISIAKRWREQVHGVRSPQRVDSERGPRPTLGYPDHFVRRLEAATARRRPAWLRAVELVGPMIYRQARYPVGVFELGLSVRASGRNRPGVLLLVPGRGPARAVRDAEPTAIVRRCAPTTDENAIWGLIVQAAGQLRDQSCKENTP